MHLIAEIALFYHTACLRSYVTSTSLVRGHSLCATIQLVPTISYSRWMHASTNIHPLLSCCENPLSGAVNRGCESTWMSTSLAAGVCVLIALPQLQTSNHQLPIRTYHHSQFWRIWSPHQVDHWYPLPHHQCPIPSCRKRRHTPFAFTSAIIPTHAHHFDPCCKLGNWLIATVINSYFHRAITTHPIQQWPYYKKTVELDFRGNICVHATYRVQRQVET